MNPNRNSLSSICKSDFGPKWICIYAISILVTQGEKKSNNVPNTRKGKKICVRSGIRTHAHIRGPEHSFLRIISLSLAP